LFDMPEWCVLMWIANFDDILCERDYAISVRPNDWYPHDLDTPNQFHLTTTEV